MIIQILIEISISASNDHKINIIKFFDKKIYNNIFFILCFIDRAEQPDTYLNNILDCNIFLSTILCIYLKAKF